MGLRGAVLRKGNRRGSKSQYEKEEEKEDDLVDALGRMGRRDPRRRMAESYLRRAVQAPSDGEETPVGDSRPRGGRPSLATKGSFWRPKRGGRAGAEAATPARPSSREDGREDDDEDGKRTTERLEAEVRLLAEKCSALESQNILVSVQQLDLGARLLSWFLSLSVLCCYWKVLLWGRQQMSWERILPLIELLRDYYYCYDHHHRYGLGCRECRGAALADSSLQTLQYSYSWVATIVLAILFVAPYVHNRRTHGSMHRRFQVFVIAFIILGRIRLCRWRAKTFGQSGIAAAAKRQNGADAAAAATSVPRFGESCTEDGIWEAADEIGARFLYLSILRLRGLWTKVAQYLGSRADFMPSNYIRELGKLQDRTAATPWEQARDLIPPRVLGELTGIDPVPLASASVGQVHAARLGSTNERVVVKVQHPHARTLLTDDFRSLRALCRIVAWMEPDYAFVEVLMDEWAGEARKELDFGHEAEHLRLARVALDAWLPSPESLVHTAEENGRVPFQVEVPLPTGDLFDRDVLVMNFCEGCRVDDFEQIEKWGLSRSAIMDGISQTFAHFMYCSDIFNGDPHPGNILVRPGTHKNETSGFTLVLLDWGLAKQLTERKRLAFCQMVYAAATLDYGLLLDSYKTVGLKMKREDTGQGMEDMRFFLRDMAPRDETKKLIKSKMKADQAKREETAEKVPMESKAYPGDFFFFIRVNELLHGLGGSYSINLGYLDALKPYAERGLRSSSMYDSSTPQSNPIPVEDAALQEKLRRVLSDLEKEDNLVGGQVCVLDKEGNTQANVVAGTLGGLRSHTPMTRDSVIFGYSTTKAVTATLAHIMVRDGFLSYDEPICDRVWPQFCPARHPPEALHRELDLPAAEVNRRWRWKREITLRHVLNHAAGLWSALPADLTVGRLASCEDCSSAYEYDLEAAGATLLPTTKPGEKSEYHYLSFGWLVAGTLCGAYGKKHNKSKVTYEEIYSELLEPKLSERTLASGFHPLGGFGDKPYAQTVTSDISASMIMQMSRAASLMGDDNESRPNNSVTEALEGLKEKEFLLDPRIWNCEGLLQANVPAAGGRFSASALASFYHDLSQGKLLPEETLHEIMSNKNDLEQSSSNALQGVTFITDATAPANNYTKMNFGYQQIRTDRDEEESFSCLGHSGVGGSVACWHISTGLCIGVMLNKSDGDLEDTKRIVDTISHHYNI